MRVLLLNQFFWPDLAATSQLLTDLARHLSDTGYDVTVICARSEYTEAADRTLCPSAKIIRSANLSFSRGVFGRILSYVSYLWCALWHGLRADKPDVIVTLTTPPLLSTIGLILQRRHGAAHYIWEMDLYPDIAIDLGLLRHDSVMARAIGLIGDYARKRANGIVVLGECMRTRLINRGIPSERIQVAENWADGTLLFPSSYKPEGTITIAYPGNVGLAHDIRTVSGAMMHLNGDQRFEWLFVGEVHAGPSSKASAATTISAMSGSYRT